MPSEKKEWSKKVFAAEKKSSSWMADAQKPFDKAACPSLVIINICVHVVSLTSA